MKKKQKNPAFRKKVPKHVRAGKIAEQAKRDARRNGYRKTVSGIFCGTRRGFGFVTPDDGSEDVFIPAGDTLNALQGDRVEIAFRRAEGEKTEGRVTALLEKNNAPVTGTVVSERQKGSRRREKNYFLYPDSTRYPERIPLPDYEGKEGEKVQVLPVRAGRLLYGEVLRTFGDSQSREANCAAILISCGIEQEFEKEALSLAEETAKQPLSAAGRAVYDAPVLTIDGADAKDLDDAVSLTKTETGYLLSVHIADVSHYVPPKSALERAAFSRGTSVYFADRVVPMLPPVLSNGACSLNAGEDKYVLSAVLSLDCAGNLLSCRIEEGILCTDVRGVYTEVNDLFARGENSPHYEKYRKVYPMLREMETLYEKLYAAAVKRGFWEPDAPEPCFLTDETGFPVEIVKKERGIAERMIEQFMLLANQGVAELLTQKGIPCVYRVHNAPDPQKIQALAVYLHNTGINPAPLTHTPLSGSDLAAVLREAEEKGKSGAVAYPLIRAQAKAVYQAEPSPHFGLGLALYCHFTSPIRRLADLATHRVIKAVLLHGAAPEKYSSFVRRAAAAASETELSAMNAERQMEDLFCALWATRHIGEKAEAVITQITGFGVFAALENSAEGLLSAEDLPYGAFLSPENLTLTLGKETYGLGDKLPIVIAEADVSRRRIRFCLQDAVPLFV